jgi:Ca-activated chloride channel family protein
VILIGRFEGGATGSIKIRGNVGGAMREVAVPVEIDETNRAPRSIPLVWARAKLADLAEQSVWQVNNELPQQARQVALEYGLMSPFTAFLAVDSSAQTAGNSGVTLNVPVPVPDGVKYETTVQEK